MSDANIVASARYGSAIILAACTAIVISGVFLSSHMSTPFDDRFSIALMFHQDLFVVAAFIMFYLVPVPWSRNNSRSETPEIGRVFLFLTIILLILACWLGHYLVFNDHDYARDTWLADFDATIIAHGRLFWPIPSDWRQLAPALNLQFILPITNHVAWVSGYLPINAASRALVGLVTDRQLTSPLYVAVGAGSLCSISKRLWPDSGETTVVALLLYASSAQIIVTGMTPYAMSGHLGLNLLWLAFFLRGRTIDHAAAIFIGFLATGLHQFLFHPMFVLPFLDLLRQRRQWRLLMVYLSAYLTIGLFWVLWPHIVNYLASGHVSAMGNQARLGYLQRYLANFHARPGRAVWLLAVNLIRLITWQNIFLLPLLLIGIRWRWRIDPFARALALSFALPIVVMEIILPWQAQGWGYRYMHGVLGNGCLLAAYGWQFLNRNGYAIRPYFRIATAVSLLVLLPVRCWMAHQMALPTLRLDREISSIPADIVIVNPGNVNAGTDRVINAPNLSNRPIRLLASKLTTRDMKQVCTHGSVAFFDESHFASDARYYWQHVPRMPTPHQQTLIDAARKNECTIRLVGHSS